MSEDAQSLDLPRKQIGPNPQHLLITLFGDFWHGRPVPIPSSALVELMQEFEISAASTRSALSRLARRGILTLHRDGRSTGYSVREEFLAAGASRATRNLTFGEDGETSRRWDGSWVIVTLPTLEGASPDRESLRPHLESWGFAPVQDGMWASVSADESEVRDLVKSLGVPGVAAFSARLLHPMDRAAARSLIEWPVSGLVAAYEDFIAHYEGFEEQARRGLMAPKQALVVRTQMMDEWRSIVRLDPDLPAEMLPDDWPRGRARVLFAALYDGLGPLAEVRCRQIVGQWSSEAAAETRHITTTSMADTEVSLASDG